MRTKKDILDSANDSTVSGISVSKAETCILEVLIDIRDQLTGMNEAPKLKAQIVMLEELIQNYTKPKDANYVKEHPEEFKVR